jgi:SAM-dependent methyltransferase
MGQKLDTRAIGLDVGLSATKWLTGAENLHYGLWTGLEVNAANVGAAQSAYTDKLFKLLPEGKLRILDIGGGAGETAAKLLALGHSVDIVVPSAFLADRCRENAPGAVVHEMMFEDFASDQPFDLCLFSESFQYIPIEIALDKAATHAPGGHIIVSDCFRTPEGGTQEGHKRKVGGGHHVAKWLEVLAARPGLEMLSEEDITEAVAPSVDVEQEFFLIFGLALTRIDEEMTRKKPRVRWVLNKIIRLVLSEKARTRILQRITERTRTAEAFVAYNRYLMAKFAVK